MNARRILRLQILLCLLLLCSTYVYANNQINQPNPSTAETSYTEEWSFTSSDQEVTITIWSQKPMLDLEIQGFQEAHPNIRVEFTNLQWEPRLSERYLNALADGTAPDILVLSQAMLGSFNSVDLIADLSESDLDLDQYRRSMGPYVWDIHQSLDGSRTIALPFEAYPFVLYYRYDIMEEYGYPAEPEELAAFLRNSGNMLQLAADLKQHDQWMLQWENDLITIVNNGQFFFNREIEYQRDSEFYRQLVESMVKFKDHAAGVSIWSPIGQEMLRNGQLVMVLLPSYGENLIADWAPEQAGRWRVTKLPLAIDAIDIFSSFSLAITEHSKNKAAAGKFLEHVMNNSTVFNWLETSPRNEYLGGQASGQFYLDVIKEASTSTVPTPLDNQLHEIWYQSIERSRQSQYSVVDTLHAATQDIMDVTSIAQEQLQRYLFGSP